MIQLNSPLHFLLEFTLFILANLYVKLYYSSNIIRVYTKFIKWGQEINRGYNNLFIKILLVIYPTVNIFKYSWGHGYKNFDYIGISSINNNVLQSLLFNFQKKC